MNFENFRGKRTEVAFAAGRAVLEVIINHPEFARIQTSCLDLVDTMANLKMPAGIVIQAESGMGKTLLLQMVKRSISARDAVENRTACLHISLDSAVDTHKLASMVMLSLGYRTLQGQRT